MANLPLASICIPLYNKKNYIARTLEAVLGQTYPNLEVVVSDNGCNDGSTEIAQEFARRDPRVKYFRLHHTVNVNESWRYAMRLAQGEFLKVHSGDDTTLQTNFLERMIEPMLKQPAVGFTICEFQPVVEATATPDLLHPVIHDLYRSWGNFHRELTLITDRDVRARKILERAAVGNGIGSQFAVVMRRTSLPEVFWKKITGGTTLWPESFADWDFMVRLCLEHRGFFVDGTTAYMHYDDRNPACVMQTSTYHHLLETISLGLLTLNVLADPELAGLRRQARPEELAQLVRIVQERIPLMLELSDDVVAFDHPHFTAKLIPRLTAIAEAYRRNPTDFIAARRLRGLRVSLAKHWLSATQIAQEYAGPYGQAQKLLLQSGIRKGVPLHFVERDLLEKARKDFLSKESPGGVAQVLTILLFSNFKDQPDLSWDWLPDWLRADLTQYGLNE